MRCPPNRLRKYSGIVKTPDDMYTGTKSQPSVKMKKIALSSNTATPIPEAAPDPASPTKCPDPILLAKRDAPT